MLDFIKMAKTYQKNSLFLKYDNLGHLQRMKCFGLTSINTKNTLLFSAISAYDNYLPEYHKNLMNDGIPISKLLEKGYYDITGLYYTTVTITLRKWTFIRKLVVYTPPGK